MTEDRDLALLEATAGGIARRHGAQVESVHLPDGSWVVSIEPTGEERGDWAVTGGGQSKAEAFQNVIHNAHDQGYA
jgi:hypothetical protein